MRLWISSSFAICSVDNGRLPSKLALPSVTLEVRWTEAGGGKMRLLIASSFAVCSLDNCKLPSKSELPPLKREVAGASGESVNFRQQRCAQKLAIAHSSLTW
mmetsp:Transcript_163626/g.524671  ORF Transcript_163626/g.524671 Transcript_163626/m.524671 type:complete len:102 (+) Transcript_163626:426-731(+)